MQRLLLTVVELKECKNSKVPRGTQGHYTEITAGTTTDAVSLMTQVADSGSTEPSPERRTGAGAGSKQEPRKPEERGESRGNESAPKSTPPTSPTRQRKGPLVFTLDTNRSTFAYDGHPTKSRPFKVSASVKNIDVLAHLDTIGATDKKYDFWLAPPSDWRQLKQQYDSSLADNRDTADNSTTKPKSQRERDIADDIEDEEISKALLLDAVGEGFSVLPFHPVHPAPPTQRGLSGKLVLRWTLISEDTIKFSYQQVQELLLRRHRLHLNALKERETEERPVEPGQSSEEKQTSPKSTRRSESDRKGVYREYQMPPYHNPFNTPRCHQTAKPFSELREAREAEFYSEGPGGRGTGGSRSQRRPQTNPTPAQSDPTLRRRESAEGDSPRTGTRNQGGAFQPRPGTTGGDITQRHLLSWALPNLSSFSSQQSWLPSFAAMESLQSQQDERGLRRDEKRRMKLAVAAEAARREQEDEEMVMADPAAEPQPEPQTHVHPSEGSPRQPLHSVSPSKNRASASSRSPRTQRYRVVANYIYHQTVRPPSGTKLAVLLNPAPPPPDRKAYLQSTNSSNIFDHLYHSSTQVSSARSVRSGHGQKSGGSADGHDSPPDSDPSSAATPADGGKSKGSAETKPPPSVALNPRLYRLRSSDPVAALKEADEWKRRLDDLRKIHPAMQQRERSKKADELDKLFVA